MGDCKCGFRWILHSYMVKLERRDGSQVSPDMTSHSHS